MISVNVKDFFCCKKVDILLGPRLSACFTQVIGKMLVWSFVMGKTKEMDKGSLKMAACAKYGPRTQNDIRSPSPPKKLMWLRLSAL